MMQKAGEGWTKAQALGQRINSPYWVMAEVKGSWLAARNSTGGPKAVPDTGRKQCKDTEMFLYFGFSVFCAMSKVQCENFHLSLKKNSANIWVLCKQEAVPGDAVCVQAPAAAGAGPSSRGSERAGKAPSQRQRRALLRARDTEPAQPRPGGTELGSLSRHLVTNKQQTKMCRQQQSALEVNRRNLESVKRICVARQRHWN